MRRLVLAVLLLWVAGCAGIPTDGSVHRVDEPADEPRGAVRYSPAGPQDGMTPEQVVRGFLDAMLAYPVSTSVAEQFLTPDAVRAWQPARQTIVYTAPRVRSLRTVDDLRRVELATRDVAVLDSLGRLTPQDRLRASELSLARVDGQWRISEAPDGILVSEAFFDSHYRSFERFSFDAALTTLVPELVHLPTGDQLPTSLVGGLAEAVTGARAAAGLRSPVADLGAPRPSVPVVGGRAEVTFDRPLRELAKEERGRLAAQIARTLAQVPQVTTLRLVGEDGVLALGDQTDLPIDFGAEFGPTAPPDHVYGLVDGRVMRVDADRVASISGPWGDDARGATGLAVGDGRVAAAFADAVRISRRDGTASVTRAADRPRSLQFDATGRLWFIDRPDARRVRLSDDERVMSLPAPGFAELDVRDFALSPDGGRYAVVTGDDVRIGLVRRDRDRQVLGLTPPLAIPVDTGEVRALVWATGTRIAVLAGTEVGDQVLSFGIDGSGQRGGASGAVPLLPDLDARQVVIGPEDGAQQWVADAEGRLWVLRAGGFWRRVTAGEVTVLVAGD